MGEALDFIKDFASTFLVCTASNSIASLNLTIKPFSINQGVMFLMSKYT